MHTLRVLLVAACAAYSLGASTAEAKEKRILQVNDLKHDAVMTWSYKVGKDRRGVDIKVKATEGQWSMVCTGWVHVERGKSTWLVGKALEEAAAAGAAGTPKKVSDLSVAMDHANRDQMAMSRLLRISAVDRIAM